jgi:hypothetical protein
VIILIALLCGVALLPPLIFVVGSRTLGPYAGGNLGAFMANFLRGLAAGGFGFWAVAVGPYALTVLLRVLFDLARRRSSTA